MNKSIPPKSSVSALSEKALPLFWGFCGNGGFDDALFRKKDVAPVVPPYHHILEMFTESVPFSPTPKCFTRLP